MKKCWSFLKKQVSIESFVLAIIVIIAIAIIFVVIMIFIPQISDKLFPRLRENVSAVSMGTMVFATLILAYATFRIITSDREQEKRDRKERWLNEIIGWAENTLECETEVSTSIASLQAGVTDRSSLTKLIHLDLFLKYRNVNARSEYVRQLALNFETDLQSAVKKATGELYAIIEFLEEHPTTATPQEVRDYRKSLELSALAVIKEATKIKTRDIS